LGHCVCLFSQLSLTFGRTGLNLFYKFGTYDAYDAESVVAATSCPKKLQIEIAWLKNRWT